MSDPSDPRVITPEQQEWLDQHNPAQPNVSMSLRDANGQPTNIGVAMTHTGNLRADQNGNVEMEVHPPGSPQQTMFVPQSHVTPLQTAQPKVAPGGEGAKVVYDTMVPWYVRDAIGDNPDTRSMGNSDLVNAVNLLNPFRGMSMPNATTTAGPVNGPAEQDPAYINRLQSAVQNALVRTPNDQYGYPLGAATTTAPVSQGVQ
jgi:hypothetical protein